MQKQMNHQTNALGMKAGREFEGADVQGKGSICPAAHQVQRGGLSDFLSDVMKRVRKVK